jgi:hypothetical protein
MDAAERSRIGALNGLAEGGSVGIALDLGWLARDLDGGGLRVTRGDG